MWEKSESKVDMGAQKKTITILTKKNGRRMEDKNRLRREGESEEGLNFIRDFGSFSRGTVLFNKAQ